MTVEECWERLEGHLRQYGFECFDVCQYDAGLPRKLEQAKAHRDREWRDTLAAARDLMLAVVDECQSLPDPVGASRCNSACDCPFGLLRARLEALGREGGE